MQIKTTSPSSTERVLSITVDEAYLAPIKQQVLNKLSSEVSLPGFRAGKAPLDLVEKNIDQTRLQNEVLEAAIEKIYTEAVTKESLWPVAQPVINLKKYVPFSLAEIEVKVEVIGPIKLGNYKSLKLKKDVKVVTPEDINRVLQNLATRMAEKKEVDRAAKDGDQAWIDFTGSDSGKKLIKGAQGKDYPLIIGSNTFIKGFEENVLGMKPKAVKTFEVTFPKDYHLSALADKKASFEITLNKVEEIIKPKIDDDFAAKTGPFKTLTELRADIKTQLEQESKFQAERDWESQIVKKIVDSSTLSIPSGLIEQQKQRLLDELKQNLVYRGQTWPEFLEAESKSEDEYLKDVIEPQAVERVKVGLVLSEIAEKEQIKISPEELEDRVKLLKTQHGNDAKMLEELDKVENHREVASRLLTEKTLSKLLELNDAK